MKQFKDLNLDFLKKFDKPGPRYTSYPTAPLFSSEFTDEDYKQEIIETNKQSDSPDLSLYFHLPYCDTLCYFCGCTMIVTRDRNKIKTYNDYLKRELDMIVPMLNKDRKVEQLHWGGGTPSYLTPEEILDLGLYIKDKFVYSDDIEASVEIDPRGLTREHIEAFAKAGFNRMSMGVQDFDLKVQETVNRVQPESITRDTVRWGRELGFKSINLDLIYGLPYQTLETFEVTVDKVIDISPERIAVFNYAHVPWLKKHQNVMPAEALPVPEQKLKILKMTIEKLVDARYWYIGMDHFAKPDDELAVSQRNHTLNRNFQGYSTKAGLDVYAFGMSSISQFRNIYAQNIKVIKDYYARIDEGRLATQSGYRMTFDDHVRKETIMNLMSHLVVDKEQISKKYDIDFNEYFKNELPALKIFEDEGYIKHSSDKIEFMPLGTLILRNIAMVFDAYLEKMRGEKPIFSRTV
jgi:oxygen-independent coproporphyrinogen-3 oxidase